MSNLRPWPEHRNPKPENSASAPYNFVPLPEKIMLAVPNAEDLPSHDKYDAERRSGYFDVTLTTLSPLYIRGPEPVPEQDLAHEGEREVKEKSEVKKKPEFFHTGDEQKPVIPGSSLRGMLRALLEVVSYSKIQGVCEKRLFFRTMDGSAIGKYYNQRMVEDLGYIQVAGNPLAPAYRARVKGGFFRVHEDGSYFIEQCTVARVETNDLLRLFNLANIRDLYEHRQNVNTYKERNPNQTPKWAYQHRKIWAEVDKNDKDYFFPQQRDNGRLRHPDLYLRFRRARKLEESSNQEEMKKKGKQQGTLVLTGHMNYKHLSFLFVPVGQPSGIKIPNDPGEEDPNKRLLARFHDNDQLTQWQKKAFPAHRQTSSSKDDEGDGHLRNGDPVFFLCNEKEELVFFGRAQMFRLPYSRRPIDLVPEELRCEEDIDYAEALFGFVHKPDSGRQQGDKSRAYAGRVSVTDGVLQSGQKQIWLEESFEKSIRPKILATPKPTAFQLYLTQQHPDEKKRLDHYDTPPPEGDRTVIRGHKLYWHQGLGTDQGLTLEEIRAAIREPAPIPPGDTQHTCFKPLQPGVKFSFRVYFENLSDVELGLLCWTLHPRGEAGRRYCHHLGMGKPLGMGAVELHARLHIINRAVRYKQLFNEGGDDWRAGLCTTAEENAERIAAMPGDDEVGEDLTVPEVQERLTRDFEKHLLQALNLDEPGIRLADIRRIAMLLKLLEWPGYRAEKDGPTYLAEQGRPNTRYMGLDEFGKRQVLPDPVQFEEAYFRGKLRPQAPQGFVAEQKPAANTRAPAMLSPKLEEFFFDGKELRGLTDYTRNERGVEVRFWEWNSAQVIGFIPQELIDRPLGEKISVVVTGRHLDSNGRVIVDLKLRPKR